MNIISQIINNSTEKSIINNFFVANSISEFIKKSNFKKEKGTTSYEILQFIFCLIFTGKNLYRTLNSNTSCDINKNTVYRFLESAKSNWRKLLLLISSHVIAKFNPLTSTERVNVLIIDDSKFSRSRSKNVELLAKVYDHVEHKFDKGFRMLALAWSDGASLIPVAFSLLSSANKKNILCPANEAIDKRTNIAKLRKEATEKSTDVMIKLIQEAKKYGVKASYVLFDSWFAFPSTIKRVLEEDFHVIAMLKAMKTVFYTYKGKLYKLENLYSITTKYNDTKSNILSSIIVEIGKDKNNSPILAKIVFVKSKNKKRDWLALITTDTSLTNENVIEIYGKRWDIEVFFKVDKSLLGLAKEFQSRSYASLVAHTTIVFIRYIMLAIQERKSKDNRTIGGLFFECCDEIKDIDFSTAINLLLNLLKNTLKNICTISEEIISGIINNFIQSLTIFFKGRSLFLKWES